MITELRDCEEKSIAGRDKIVGEATRYYKENYENIEGTNVDGILKFKKGVDNDADPFARIIKSEISDVSNNLKGC